MKINQKKSIIEAILFAAGRPVTKNEFMLALEMPQEDIDNIVKIILDAMNKCAFKDDTQITKLQIEKKYGEEEKIWIKIEEY